ncbi:MAG: hypothetical protein JO307_03790 [Bryobacterales bacterium]|nr:hypothetical protein [Bryobacterales bacterium]MBV9401625.1 hypothetical protein [Bryobacterales bacterium]
MKNLLKMTIVLCGAALASAQDAAPKNTQALIDVKYADVNRLAALLGPIYGGNVRADPTLHVIAVSGNPDLVNAVTAAIKKLDVPPPQQPDVELTVYLISGLTQGQGADEVPQDLASTIKQLHGLFSYKMYKLADTVVLRGRAVPRGEVPFGNQRTDATGVLPGPGDLHYYFSYNTLNITPDNPRTVHVNNLTFRISGRRRVTTLEKNLTTTSEVTDNPASISTDLDLREGQKTVVGKSSVNAAGDALILVIVPKVTE